MGCPPLGMSSHNYFCATSNLLWFKYTIMWHVALTLQKWNVCWSCHVIAPIELSQLLCLTPKCSHGYKQGISWSTLSYSNTHSYSSKVYDPCEGISNSRDNLGRWIRSGTISSSSHAVISSFKIRVRSLNSIRGQKVKIRVFDWSQRPFQLCLCLCLNLQQYLYFVHIVQSHRDMCFFLILSMSYHCHSNVGVILRRVTTHLKLGFKYIWVYVEHYSMFVSFKYNSDFREKLRWETHIQTELSTSHCYITRVHLDE